MIEIRSARIKGGVDGSPAILRTLGSSPEGQVGAAIVRRLRERGFEAWLAGGCVRDALLGETPHDFDVATSAKPDEVRPLFEKVVDTGVRFGTVTVVADEVPIQVTTFRAEGVYADGRRPTSLTFGVSLLEDAKRRDFTINALFADPASGEVVDLVGGVEDLAKRRIRAVGDAGERFDEDALRLLRAIRFTAKLRGELDPETERAARARPHLLRRLSAERVGEELKRMLLGPDPRLSLGMLERFGFLDEILPEVAATRGVPQPPEFHPEGDVWFHTIDVVDRLERRTLALALAALFHDVGKALTLTWTDRIRFHGHEPVSCELAQARLRQLRFGNEILDEVIDLVAEHIRFGSYPQWRRARQLRFLAKPNIRDHLALHRADRGSQGGDLDVHARASADLAALEAAPPTPAPLLRGEDLVGLGLAPGPRFKVILESVRDAQLEGSLSTRDEALDHVRRHFPLESEGPPGR